MSKTLNRRRFLASSTLAAGAALTFGRPFARGQSPNEKLSVGVVGVAGQGGYNLSNVLSENIVALCDVDQQRLGAAAEKHPSARRFADFRKLLEMPGLDAVVVSTPDHTHAVAAVAALSGGRHVYCEKPLARTLSETRAIQNAAAKHNRVTQIGTQIHAGGNYRRVVEMVQSGALGAVREVHVWVASSYGGIPWPATFPDVPAGLDYDLWLGPVQPVPFSPEWVPFKWRNWWHFGGGSLADFGCHFMDLPHWALDLKAPLSAEAEGPKPDGRSVPPWLVVRYEHPARAAMPPVRLTWHHGDRKPKTDFSSETDKWASGVLFIGDKGALVSDYSKHKLLPEEKFANHPRPPQTIPDSIGHHKEWIEAIKTGGKTTCPFDYSGPLTEAALLGNLAFRVGEKINWDSANLKAVNSPRADEFIHHHYRAGWTL